ncbi:conserved hypothetical protein [Ricinus communis]|uniref:Uncharacterized protein n=1 Tax=Ricinus communis TaxID=3988 RepID=B9RAC4_RICCO|nr:conserved hypothetical protein [Ricinus communis]
MECDVEVGEQNNDLDEDPYLIECEYLFDDDEELQPNTNREIVICTGGKKRVGNEPEPSFMTKKRENFKKWEKQIVTGNQLLKLKEKIVQKVIGPARNKRKKQIGKSSGIETTSKQP